MNLDKKFQAFLEISKVLNTNGVIPVLYGSVGLYRIIGQQDEIDDIDIVVPPVFVKEKFPELVKIMNTLGYEADSKYSHEFVREGERIGFEPDDLYEFAGIDTDSIKVSEEDGVQFKELSPNDYLKFYKKTLAERERKIEKVKAKIAVLEKILS